MSRFGSSDWQKEKVLQVITASEGSAPPPTPLYEVVQKFLTRTDVAEGMSYIGKDETGQCYAYLKVTLVDMQLTDISVLLHYKHLRYVDLSDNLLEIQGLQEVMKLPFLMSLNAQNNRVASVELTPHPYFQVLNLSGNLITDLAPLRQRALLILNLSHNAIFSVRLDTQYLPKLVELSLDGNCLRSLDGSYPLTLEKLYLSHNEITRVSSNISKLTNLKHLHLRGNKIRHLRNFTESLKNLTYLNLRDNLIKDVKHCRNIHNLKNLKVIILLDNPLFTTRRPDDETVIDEESEDEVQGEEEEEENSELNDERKQVALSKVRLMLLALVPGLERINKIPVTVDERNTVMVRREKYLQEIFEEESTDDDRETEIMVHDFEKQQSSYGDQLEPSMLGPEEAHQLSIKKYLTSMREWGDQ